MSGPFRGVASLDIGDPTPFSRPVTLSVVSSVSDDVG